MHNATSKWFKLPQVHFQNKTHPFKWLFWIRKRRLSGGTVKVTQLSQVSGCFEWNENRDVLFHVVLLYVWEETHLISPSVYVLTFQRNNMTFGFTLFLCFESANLKWNFWSLDESVFKEVLSLWLSIREMKLKLTGQHLNRTGNFLVFGVAAIHNISFFVASLSEFRLVVWVEALRMSLWRFSCIQISYHCSLWAICFLTGGQDI